MKTEREGNYDLLRVTAMLAVIVIHVSARWINGFEEFILNGQKISEWIHPEMAYVYSTISRFAVPCFIMLSGAFMIDDDRTADYREFYQRRFLKVGIPTLVFSVLYSLYSIPFCFVGEYSGFSEIIVLIGNIIKGEPFYHMWYLYMLIGVYIFAPLVVRFKNSISYANFRKTAIIFLIWATFSRWTTENVRLHWDLGQAFEYLGYFMIGYIIRKDLQKNNRRGILLLLSGVMIETATAFVRYRLLKNGITETELGFGISAPYAPIIVIASVLIFAGFTMLEVQYCRWIKKLSEMSFIIYLVHAGVWDVLSKIFYLTLGKDYALSLNALYWIPILTVMTGLLSVLLTIFFNRIESCAVMKKVNSKIADFVAEQA